MPHRIVDAQAAARQMHTHSTGGAAHTGEAAAAARAVSPPVAAAAVPSPAPLWPASSSPSSSSPAGECASDNLSVSCSPPSPHPPPTIGSPPPAAVRALSSSEAGGVRPPAPAPAPAPAGPNSPHRSASLTAVSGVGVGSGGARSSAVTAYSHHSPSQPKQLLLAPISMQPTSSSPPSCRSPTSAASASSRSQTPLSASPAQTGLMSASPLGPRSPMPNWSAIPPPPTTPASMHFSPMSPSRVVIGGVMQGRAPLVPLTLSRSPSNEGMRTLHQSQEHAVGHPLSPSSAGVVHLPTTALSMMGSPTISLSMARRGSAGKPLPSLVLPSQAVPPASLSASASLSSASSASSGPTSAYAASASIHSPHSATSVLCTAMTPSPVLSYLGGAGASGSGGGSGGEVPTPGRRESLKRSSLSAVNRRDSLGGVLARASGGTANNNSNSTVGNTAEPSPLTRTGLAPTPMRSPAAPLRAELPRSFAASSVAVNTSTVVVGQPQPQQHSSVRSRASSAIVPSLPSQHKHHHSLSQPPCMQAQPMFPSILAVASHPCSPQPIVSATSSSPPPPPSGLELGESAAATAAAAAAAAAAQDDASVARAAAVAAVALLGYKSMSHAALASVAPQSQRPAAHSRPLTLSGAAAGDGPDDTLQDLPHNRGVRSNTVIAAAAPASSGDEIFDVRSPRIMAYNAQRQHESLPAAVRPRAATSVMPPPTRALGASSHPPHYSPADDAFIDIRSPRPFRQHGMALGGTATTAAAPPAAFIDPHVFLRSRAYTAHALPPSSAPLVPLLSLEGVPRSSDGADALASPLSSLSGLVSPSDMLSSRAGGGVGDESFRASQGPIPAMPSAPMAKPMAAGAAAVPAMTAGSSAAMSALAAYGGGPLSFRLDEEAPSPPAAATSSSNHVPVFHSLDDASHHSLSGLASLEASPRHALTQRSGGQATFEPPALRARLHSTDLPAMVSPALRPRAISAVVTTTTTTTPSKSPSSAAAPALSQQFVAIPTARPGMMALLQPSITPSDGASASITSGTVASPGSPSPSGVVSSPTRLPVSLDALPQSTVRSARTSLMAAESDAEALRARMRQQACRSPMTTARPPRTGIVQPTPQPFNQNI